MCSTEKDVRTRVAEAWSALDRLTIICKSWSSGSLKRNFLRAIVESVLVYGSTTWILTKQLEDKLGGTYCRMLCAILNKSWQQHPTTELYGSVPKLSDIIREQRTRFASHYWQNKTELVNELLLWIRKHDHTQVGGQFKTYINQLALDTRMQINDLKNAIEVRKYIWRWRVNIVRVTRSIR